MVPSLQDLAVNTIADTIGSGLYENTELLNLLPENQQQKIKQRLLWQHSNLLSNYLLASNLRVTKKIYSVAFSPDGNYAITGSDTNALLWDIKLAHSSLDQLANTIAANL
jgi:WD40 repeat protein